MAFRPAFLALVGSILVVAGCSVDSVVSVEPLPDTSVPDTSVPDASVPGGSPDSTQPGGATTESTTPATPVTPAEPVPVVGECRGSVTMAVIESPTDTRATIACDGTHGFETIFVGELPADLTRWPGGALGGGVFRFVNDACSPALDAYLGPRPQGVQVPDRVYGFSFYFPTEEDWQAGSRWFRCDAYVQPLTDDEETVIDGTLQGVYSGPLPDAYRICEGVDGELVGCDEPHTAEWLAAIDLRDVEDYPAETDDPLITQRCTAAVQQVLGLTANRTDLALGYQLPRRDTWAQSAAQRQAICVVAAADGRALTGTLAGIGDAGALPVEGTGAGA